MNNDFARVRAMAARSLMFAWWSRLMAGLQVAWRASIVGGRLTRLASGIESASSSDRLRWCATAIAVASAAQLVVRPLMPATVVPAIPAVCFLALAAGGAVIAWNAEAFHHAWGNSRWARLIRRL